MSARAVGRSRRVLGALQVLLACGLAFGAALLAIDLANWRYARVDLSASARNTLEPEVAEIVERLPQPARVDVFLRALEPPYDQVWYEAQGRMLELLFTARNAWRDRLSVELYDDRTPERTRTRQAELGVEGTNFLVVSSGERRTSVPLFGGVASIDWGSPTPRGVRYLLEQGIGGVVDAASYDPARPRPARLTGFRGQEALAEALLKVASGERPKVLFTSGHGEPDPFGSRTQDTARLRQALERDGFEVGTWNGRESGPLPAGTAVLLALGAEQPFDAAEREAIRDWVASGGRLIAAPSFREVEEGLEGGTASLLFGYGMIVEPGVVCQGVRDSLGRAVEGLPECARLLVSGTELSPSHPLTEMLRRRGLRLEFVLTHSFRRGALAAGGLLLELIQSPASAWRDQAASDGSHDFRFDPLQESRARARLVMLAELTGRAASDGEPLRGRVLGIASAGFCTDGSFDTNHDFLVSAVNFLAEREELVRVSPSELTGHVLDLQRGRAKPVLFALLVVALPGSLALLGAGLAWRRRR